MPTLNCPTDALDNVGRIKWSYPCVVVNIDPEIQLVDGKLQMAMSISGYCHVDFPMKQGECFNNPDMCQNGMTYAMWLWLSATQYVDETFIIHTGTYDEEANGILVAYNNIIQQLTISVNSKNTYNSISVVADTESWLHLAFTWTEECVHVIS